jgi:hypothetical protein
MFLPGRDRGPTRIRLASSHISVQKYVDFKSFKEFILPNYCDLLLKQERKYSDVWDVLFCFFNLFIYMCN